MNNITHHSRLPVPHDLQLYKSIVAGIHVMGKSSVCVMCLEYTIQILIIIIISMAKYLLLNLRSPCDYVGSFAPAVLP